MKSNIKINYFYNVIYQILSMLIPLITIPYVSRIIGSEGIGIYSYTYSVAGGFALVGMLGVSNYGNRAIASSKDNYIKKSIIFWNVYMLQFLVSLGMLFVYIGYVFLICPEKYKAISLIQVMVILSSLCDISWYYFGMEKFKLTVSRNIIIKCITFVLILTIIHNQEDLLLYTLILAGAALINNLVLWFYMKKEVSFARVSKKEMEKHIYQVLILFIPVIAVTLYKKMDKVMLGLLSSMSQTGFYENAEKIINIPNSLITALGTVMMPRISYLAEKRESSIIKEYIKQSMKFVSFFACALTFGIGGIAIEFAPVFFGQEFEDVGAVIMSLAPTILFVSWANVIRTQYLIPLHHDKIYVVSVWLGAIVNLVTNLMLIPKFGAFGAAIGTVLAEGMVMLYQIWKVRKELPIASYARGAMYYFIVGFIMFCVVRVIGICNHQKFVVIYQITVGAIVYLCCCAIKELYRNGNLKYIKKWILEVRNFLNI